MGVRVASATANGRRLRRGARRTEVTGRSAVGAEASALALLVDALPFGLFLGRREVHGGRAEIGRVAGDVGGW